MVGSRGQWGPGVIRVHEKWGFMGGWVGGEGI